MSLTIHGGFGLPGARRIDQDKEQFSPSGSSGQDFGLLRIRGDNHEAVGLVRT
ncbi:hypothetical protein [Arthrobacter sp. FW306-04-A]|uniref:hypothetical protein n=1 Tax=Arthrobacter sp. FW306-04-A TaxID=2879619 RepID=UPI0037BF244C